MHIRLKESANSWENGIQNLWMGDVGLVVRKKKQCHDKINIRIRMQIKGTNVATGWLSRI